MSQILAITGMHRSGTSLVSNLLQAGGVNVGDKLLPPSESNPRGFFEDIDFYEFHEHLLNSRGQHYLYVERDFVFEPTQADKTRARELGQQRSHLAIWGWKDPRTSLFLDFWAQQFPESRFLFVVRHPLEVLCSLLRRGEFEHLTILDAVLQAWHTYNENIRLFRDRYADRCLIVHVEGVIHHIDRFAKLLRKKFQLDFNLDEAAFRKIYHGEELKRTQHLPKEALILRKLYPGLLELYDKLAAQSDLPADVVQENDAASPQLSALADLATTMAEPVTLPVRHSLLALLLSSHAPELANAKLTNLSLAGRAIQQRIDRLWLQYTQLERINSEQRVRLDEQQKAPVSAVAPSANTEDQSQPNRNWSVPGFNRVFTAPAQLRMPERVALYSLIFGIQPQIGSAQGGSAAIVCAAMNDTGSGRIACVDPAPQIRPELWSEISHRCRMFEGASPGILATAHKEMGADFDFVLIDGDHECDAVRTDIDSVLPFLTEQAYLLFHDAHHEGVKTAIHEAVSMSPQLIDCGLVSVEPTVLQENGKSVAYAGFRLVRFERAAGEAEVGNHLATANGNAADQLLKLNAPQKNSTSITIQSSVNSLPPITEPRHVDAVRTSRRMPVLLAGNECLSGVTTWAEGLRRELADHPRYDVRLLYVGKQRPSGFDYYSSTADEARAIVRGLAPAILVPNYVWDLHLANADPGIGCLGMCHCHSADEYYLPLSWYESTISHFIAVSEQCGRELSERLPFRANDITTLPYGVHVPSELHRNYETAPLRMIYAGRLVQPQKRVGDFVPLVAQLLQAQIPFTFDIVGDGMEFDWLKHALQEWFPSAQVRFHGRLPQSAVDAMWSSQDVFIQTSDFEGTSVSMIEAMAQGVVPIVTAGSSGVANIIEHGKNGFILPVGDSTAMVQTIGHLAANPALLASVGTAAYQSAQAFAMGPYCERFISVLDKVASATQAMDQMKSDGGFGGHHPLYLQHQVIRMQQEELADLRARQTSIGRMGRFVRRLRKRFKGKSKTVDKRVGRKAA
jgi:glycosyltransferase involved in cell wall biosynthesis/predicted O-methyltransferase YrrM